MTELRAFNDLLIPLHIINLAGTSLTGKTRLQKIVFLSQIEFQGNFNYEFKQAPLGPLSNKLLDAVDELKKRGLIKEIKDSTLYGNRVYRYEITEEGNKFLDYGISSHILPEETIAANKKAMETYGKMQHAELLDYVHSRYPEYRAEGF
jgi:uncharacterized protein YwgA